MPATSVARRAVIYPRRPMPHASATQESKDWPAALRGKGADRDRAIRELHQLLLKAARFELGRRRAALSYVRGEELDDIATQAANDALMAVSSKLDDYRGESRFTTWAYKFALLEAGVKLRRRAWQDREVVLDSELAAVIGHGSSAQGTRTGGNARTAPGAMVTHFAAPAPGVHRPRTERGADRRARRAARHDPRRPLQDIARRTPEATPELGLEQS